MIDAQNRASVPRDGDTRAEIVASTEKSMLVEAAAGTGKTTLVVDRILRGIRDGTLRLPTTVAITFTEKAAGELEERVRSGLGRELCRPDLTDQERDRLDTAAEELDRANISTIHAFCSRILREKSAEAGVDPEFSVLEATQAEMLRERAWQEWMGLQVSMAPAAGDGGGVLLEALRAGVNVGGLRAPADALTAAPELLDLPGFVLAAPPQSREELTEQLCQRADRAAKLCREHMRGQGNVHSRMLHRLAEDIAAAGSADASGVRRRAYAAARVSVDDALSSFAKDRREEAGRVLGEFSAAAQALGAHLARDVFHWLGGFVEHYREAKLSRSVLDFQDLLLLTARMLRTDLAVRRYFQQRFDAFFVDEFQDTDPLQAELIAYLCEDTSRRSARRGKSTPARSMAQVRLADGKLFAVGDPKQSIYRFRRADVQIYDRFKGLFGPQAFGEERVRQVSCNFRSTPRLLEWFNRLFDRLFVRPEQEGVYQAAHVPLLPPWAPSAGPAEKAGGPPVVAVCPPEGASAEKQTAPTARRKEARSLALLVRDAVRGELGPSGGDTENYGCIGFHERERAVPGHRHRNNLECKCRFCRRRSR